jgi:hypothetical protein
MGIKEHDNEPVRGVTLDLFGDLEPSALPAPDGARGAAARGSSRTRRGGAAAARHAGPQAGAALPVAAPAAAVDEAASVDEVTAAAAGSGGYAVGCSVEQALRALPAQALQDVVGQVATAIVRSGEFQVALRAQLYTLVAPAITDALRGALSVQEIRQSLRDAFGDGASSAQALRLAQAAAYAREAAAPHAAAPRVAHVGQSTSAQAEGQDAAQPLGEAVLLAGYEPSLARQYKAALAEAGYEALIVEIGPNDSALPVEAFQCAIACLPDDVLEHVESVVSRHPLRHVLHVSATPRRLVEAVELVLPLPQRQG